MNFKDPLSQISIVYQDADILAINKPAGVVVNRAQSVQGKTLQDWLEENVPEINSLVHSGVYPDGWMSLIPDEFTDEFGSAQEIFLQRSGIAHRLDKQTSGVMLVAKHPGSLLHLLKQFKQREIQKQYICLVHGQFSVKSGEISAPLGRRSGNRKLFGVVAGGRPAITEYEVTTQYQNFDLERLVAQTGEKQKRFSLYTGFSLVKCFPKTGRTHQIRVHMAHIAHPIVGDSSYVGKKRSKLDVLWCNRHFLHAQTISFVHPRTHKLLEITAPLSDDLQSVLGYLS